MTLISINSIHNYPNIYFTKNSVKRKSTFLYFNIKYFYSCFKNNSCLESIYICTSKIYRNVQIYYGKRSLWLLQVSSCDFARCNFYKCYLEFVTKKILARGLWRRSLTKKKVEVISKADHFFLRIHACTTAHIPWHIVIFRPHAYLYIWQKF